MTECLSLKAKELTRCLDNTNLESEKGFNFFQKFMKSSGAIDRLEELDDVQDVYSTMDMTDEVIAALEEE